MPGSMINCNARPQVISPVNVVVHNNTELNAIKKALKLVFQLQENIPLLQ